MFTQRFNRRWHCFLLLVLVLSYSAPVGQARAVTPRDTAVAGNCRFGITVTTGKGSSLLSELSVGAYLDWAHTPRAPVPPGLDYIHVVRLRDGARQYVYDPQLPEVTARFESSLREAVEHYPGQAWLVGNEPDTAFENQDALTPDAYALAYGRVYRLIKSVDPTARVGIGTIVQPTPLRLQWLEQMWASYRTLYRTDPPSEFWSIHSFILREKAGDWGTGVPPGLAGPAGELYTLEQTNDVDIFKTRLMDFRRWMAGHGQRAKPLWITEYGSLLPHDGRTGLVTQPIERARDYMLATFDYLLAARDSEVGYPYDGDRLVQRWFWYSLDDHLWRFGGSLFDPDTGQRTLVGDAFVDYVADLPVQPELHLIMPSATVVHDRRGGAAAFVMALVSNAGSGPTTAPVSLSWYEGDPGRGGHRLGSPITLASPLPGCGSAQWISARLPLPTWIQRPLYVVLESDDLAQPEVLPAQTVSRHME